MTIDHRQEVAAAVAPPAEVTTRPPSRVVDAWLSLLFFAAGVAPWLLTILRPFAIRVTTWSSRAVRQNTRCNARWIFGRELSDREARRFARNVVGSFYDFVTDVGRSSASETAGDFLRRLESDDGRQQYLETRKAGRGAVLVTAHMGAFEVGLAALRQAKSLMAGTGPATTTLRPRQTKTPTPAWPTWSTSLGRSTIRATRRPP